MRFAAPLALTGISGLLVLILLEILEVVLPPILMWLVGIFLFVAAIALKMFLGFLAMVVTVLLIRWFRKRHEAAA